MEPLEFIPDSTSDTRAKDIESILANTQELPNPVPEIPPSIDQEG